MLVAHADASFVPSTAELALALMLDLARNVTESTVDYRSGVRPAQRAGLQLKGRVAGIIGYGAIGSYLANILRSMGMSVLVNVSRGELLDEAAVEAVLDSGHLGGLAMDVGRAPDQRPSPEQVEAIVHGTMPPRTANAEDASRLRSWWSDRSHHDETP